VTSPISATNVGGKYRADALDREQVPVARVVAQPGVQIDLDRGDLIGQHQHQSTLRRQPLGVGAGQLQGVQ